MKKSLFIFTLVLFNAIFSNAIFGQNRIPPRKTENILENKSDYAPGQIQIYFQKSSVKSKSTTYSSVINDYNHLQTIVKQIGLPVTKTKAVFQEFVNEMQEKNISESELLQLKLPNSTFKNDAEVFHFSKYITLYFDDKIDVLDIISKMKNNKDVFLKEGFELLIIEPNYLFKIEIETVNDEHFDKQWGLNRISCPEAWTISKGSKNVIVGVIDTGVDMDHEDLKDNLSEDVYDFVDIYIDSYLNEGYVLCEGEDYVDVDDTPSDFNSHGTHCAGIIGAVQNNQVGISGVCPEVTLMPIRAGFSINDSSGTEFGILESDDIARAIVFAADHGADIISMSFGSSSSSAIEREAIEYAQSLGVVMIASAGNMSSNIKFYPAAYDNVISVSALTENNKKADFSSYGDWVDIIAPGQNIYSTVPTSGGNSTNEAAYSNMSGTSMAGPIVAGVAALLKSVNTDLTAMEIEAILKMSSDFPDEQDLFFGVGVINANNALLMANTIITEAFFSNPEELAIITETFILNGEQMGNSAKVYIGKGYYPNSFEVLIENSTDQNFWIVINPELYDDGIYTLKLEVSTENTTSTYFRRFFIGDLKGLQQGWPVTLDTYSYPTSSISDRLSIGDLNNDSLQEIVIVSEIPNDPEHVNSNTFAQAVYVLNHKGELLENWPYVLPEGGDHSTKPIICDIDNNGEKEIIISSRCTRIDWEWQPNLGSNQIFIFNIDGTIREGWPVYIDARDYSTSISIADINLDGNLEIICASGGGQCSRCSDKGGIHVFDIDGNELAGWPVQFEDYNIPRSPFAVTNIDDDPELEILVTKFNKLAPNDSLHYTCVYNHDGTIVDKFPLAQNMWGWPLATADFDNDGKAEIMTQYGLLSNTGELKNWGYKTNAYSDISFANVDDDPEPEICFGNINGKAYILNEDGTNVPGWPVSGGNNSTDNGIFVADVAGDDKPEIIPLFEPNTTSSTLNEPGLSIYTSDGKLLDGYPRFKNIHYFNKVEISDIDNDGDVELIALDGVKNMIFVFDFEKQNKLQEWPREYHDNCNTNNYIPKIDTSKNQIPKIIGQHEVLIYDDFVIPIITDLIIEDEDNIFPNDFTLAVVDHDSYNHDKNIVYPKETVTDSLIVLVKVFDQEDESDIFQMVIKASQNTSIEEDLKKSALQIYPNPNQGVFKIDYSSFNKKNIVVEIYDFLGHKVFYKKILSANSNAKYLDIDLSTHKKGIYLLKLTSDKNEIGYGKIIIN